MTRRPALRTDRHLWRIGQPSTNVCDGCQRADRQTRWVPFSGQSSAAQPVVRGHIAICLSCATRPERVQAAVRRALGSSAVADPCPGKESAVC